MVRRMSMVFPRRKVVLYIFFSVITIFVIIQTNLLTASNKIHQIKQSYNNLVAFPQHGPSSNILRKLNNSASLFRPIDDKFEDPISRSIMNYNYASHEIVSFQNNLIIDVSKGECSNLSSIIPVQISRPFVLDAPLYTLAETIFHSKYPYQDFFSKVPQELSEGTIEKYWFRFGGCSVWLKEFGLHFHISRVIYTPTGDISSPLISFAYAQIYDANWDELFNIKLSFPSKNDKTNAIEYKLVTFPAFLPIDIYYEMEKGKTWGPEDPRILTIENELGFEEPLIIFNMLHRLSPDDPDYDHQDENDEQYNNYYRSIFGYLPFSGKQIEFKFKDSKRLQIQKNWTPFVAPLNFENNQLYHKKINFVYRYQSLNILECSIATGLCTFTYKLDPNTKSEEAVGEMRGGTALIPIPSHKSISLPEGKQVWIGFARAHIDNCGCGSAMYRPNFFVLEKYGSHFEISYMSGSIGFDIPIIGWGDADDICNGNNVLIPNGISYWDIHDVKFGDDIGESKVKVDDYLGLTVSVSDRNVQILHIKGLLDSIMKLPAINALNTRDVNTDNVFCALENSRDFCYNYGARMDPMKHIALGLIESVN